MPPKNNKKQVAGSKQVAAPTPVPAPTLGKSEVESADKVLRRILGTDKESAGKMAKLPLVSAIYNSQDEMNRAISMLNQGIQLTAEIKRLEQGTDESMGLEDVKDEITAIAVGAEVEGYRFGNSAVLVSSQTRRTLNKEKLASLMLDEGIDPKRIGQIIEDAHKESEPFYVVKFGTI